MRGNGDLLALAVVIGLGMTQSLQVALLGAMGRARGPIEAAWVSILGTVTGLGLALVIQSLSGRRPALPAPFDAAWAPAAVALVSGALLAVVIQGLPAGYLVTGLLAAPYIASAAFLAPKLGVGLFMAAVITGQLLAGVAFDHVGAFGATPRPIDVPRVLGVIALLIGVILIRGRK